MTQKRYTCKNLAKYVHSLYAKSYKMLTKITFKIKTYYVHVLEDST